MRAGSKQNGWAYDAMAAMAMATMAMAQPTKEANARRADRRGCPGSSQGQKTGLQTVQKRQGREGVGSTKEDQRHHHTDEEFEER